MELQTLPPLHSRGRLHNFTGLSLRYLEDVAERTGRLYSPFDVRKKGMEKWRHIDNPKIELKMVQRRLLGLLQRQPLPPYMFGATKGHDALDHARMHVGQPWVLALDLRDCFPRTHHHKVFGMFCDEFGCSERIASALTRLTTYQHRLPQGAPTSTYVAQLSMLPMVRKIYKVTQRAGLLFSIYVDDVVISGDGVHGVIGEVIRIIAEHGHRIRHAKKHIMSTRHGEILVTGAAIGPESLLCAKDYERRFVDSIREQVVDGTMSERQKQSLIGRLAYIRRLEPRLADVLDELKTQLPRVVEGGSADDSVEQRQCYRASRHRYKRPAE